jgi:hypothetical protein
MGQNRNKKTRREFIADVAKASAAVAVGGTMACSPDVGGEWATVSDECVSEPQPPVETASRVVEVFREDSVVDMGDGTFERNDPTIRPMVEDALAALTDGADNPWRTILPDYSDAMRIGLKINSLNTGVPTSVCLVKALVDSLKEHLGIGPDRLIVWDRRLNELVRPPALSYDADELGAQVMGTQTSETDLSGPGYSAAFCGEINGRAPKLSRILTDLTDVTINVPVLKTHGICGVTTALKNIYGIIDNPFDYHDTLNSSMPALAQLPPIRDHIRLVVIDALFAVTAAGTYDPPDAYPKRILMSYDPLAIDKYAIDLVNQIRTERTDIELSEVDSRLVGWLENARDLGVGSLEYDLVKG